MTMSASCSSRRGELLAIAAQGFAKSGFGSCSIRDIAEEANILSGSLYHHFSSKDEMVIEILDSYWQTLFESYDAVGRLCLPPADSLFELIVASLRVAEICPNEVRILHQDWHYLTAITADLGENMARVETTFTSTITAAMELGVFRTDIDVALAYRSIMGAVAWVTRWYRTDGEFTMEEIGQIQARFWLEGLRADKSIET